MLRYCVIVLALVACDEGTKSKVKDGVKKVDNAVDKLEADDAKEHLERAKVALADGNEPAEECSWAARATETPASKSSLDELRLRCAIAVPYAKAAAAVVRAEKARGEVPDAPSITECQSDDWAKAKATLDDKASGDQSWLSLKARWAKVCPDQK
jgi:hypothetical protein